MALNHLEDREIRALVCAAYRPLGLSAGFYVRLRFLLAPMIATARLVQSGGPVLDLGCGVGMFAQILRAFDPGRRIAGIDRDPRRIQLAQAAARGGGITFSVGDARDFELNETTHVAIVDLLHHMPVPAQNALLCDLAARVRPGTILLIKEVERRPGWKYWLHYVQDSVSYRFSPLWFRTREEIIGLLESCAFLVRVVDLGGIHPHVAYLAVKQ